MGQDGKTVAPDAISGSAFAIAGALVMMAGITGVVYLRTQWGVTSPKDLGDKLRERGAARKEALEQGSGAKLVRTFSASAEQGVKANVDLVDADGKTALTLARAGDHAECVALLVEAASSQP